MNPFTGLHVLHAGAGAAAAAVAQAVKASGAIVSVEPDAFQHLVNRAEKPLVVHAETGIFRKQHQYLFGYKGLVFFTKSPEPLPLTTSVDVLPCKRIWIPH